MKYLDTQLEDFREKHGIIYTLIKQFSVKDLEKARQDISQIEENITDCEQILEAIAFEIGKPTEHKENMHKYQKEYTIGNFSNIFYSQISSYYMALVKYLKSPIK